jgi:hypothetical protein
MRTIVLAPDFLNKNYLSTELRVPVSLIGINACSPLATNAIRGNIWDNFSSESYKQLPPVGTIKIRNPISGTEMDYPLPAGGRGYVRPASLVSVWSTAPFLQNNTVGPFYWDPSVKSRMDVFNESIEQMLWPEQRLKDDLFSAQGPGIGVIDRLTMDSYLEIPLGYLPPFIRPLLGLFPKTKDGIKIGPFPKNMPVGLITNIDLLGADLPDAEKPAHLAKLLELVKQMAITLKPNADPSAIRTLEERMLDMSKCKDLVVNKGHYFGTSYFSEEPPLSDDDKRALIAFLKTF